MTTDWEAERRAVREVEEARRTWTPGDFQTAPRWELVVDLSTLVKGEYLRVELPEWERPDSANDAPIFRRFPKAAYEGELIALMYGEHLVLNGHETLFLNGWRPARVFRMVEVVQ